MITCVHFYALHTVYAEYKVIHDPEARKHINEKTKRTGHVFETARSNNSEDILDELSPVELYIHNLYLEFTESSNIHPKKLKSLLDRILGDYNKLMPGFLNGIQSEVDFNLDLFWLDKMSPRDSTYRSGLTKPVCLRNQLANDISKMKIFCWVL